MAHVIAMCIESPHKYSFVKKGHIKKNIFETNSPALLYMQTYISSLFFYMSGLL